MIKNKKSIKCFFSYDKLFFLFAAALSIVLTFFATKNCIDSDASGELILAEHLSRSGGILSSDWLYSTELRVINTQLIYAPLFLLFKSWHLVRFFGALLLQGCLIFSFYLFSRLIGLDRRAFFISAGLLLLPISVCWGRIVLYNCYYIPHLCFSLLLVGLTFSKKRSNLLLLPLCLLALLGGLGGIRQLMMTHAPILLATFIYWLLFDFSKGRTEPFLKKQLPLLLRACLGAAFSLIGFIINSTLLSKLFVFASYNKGTIGLMDMASIKNLLYGFFHHFGFRDEVRFLSILGILSLLGLLLGLFCIALSIRRIARCKKKLDFSQTLPQVFFLSFCLVMFLVFMTIGSEFYFVLYLTPLIVWMVPVFVMQGLSVAKSTPWLSLKRLLPYAAVLLILTNGLVNGAYFLNDNYFPQKYEGLYFQNRNIKKELAGAVSFLKENGYTLGYATFWNSNILTEMTDGKIKTIHVSINGQTGALAYYDWLTLKSNRTLKNQKDFLLLEKAHWSALENSAAAADYKLIYSDELFAIYDILPEKPSVQ